MQADIFNVEVKKLTTEQGPGKGAAMIAAVGCHWFNDMKACTNKFSMSQKHMNPFPKTYKNTRNYL